MSNANPGAAPNKGPRPNALDPRSPLLVQPFKRLVDEGFIVEINVKFTPTGFTCGGKPDSRMIAVKNSGLVQGTEYPLGQLSAVADQGNLIPLKKTKAKGGKGQEQPLPKKTLTKKDFELSDEEFTARCISVADACGGTTLVGRVRSAQAFEGTITTSFQNWWRAADKNARMIALSQEKQRKDVGEDELKRLEGLQCPFRGSAEFHVVDEEDDEPAQAGPSTPIKEPERPAPKAKANGTKKQK
jgi:hypothetical protein